MAEQDLDRSQEATPHKLQKAKERGQVAKSRDVVSVSVFTVAMVYLSWRCWPVWREQFLFDRALLLQAARLDASTDNLWGLVARSCAGNASTYAPDFAEWISALQQPIFLKCLSGLARRKENFVFSLTTKFMKRKIFATNILKFDIFKPNDTFPK